ncbi:hypothetical protein ABT275_40840 [Streptomyces sp. NPDC001185]|uniref:hypothetical protein n=1 Tax=Streptomyces sp. NPDC001185 TaxID=3154380 RepID=UPI00332433EE
MAFDGHTASLIPPYAIGFFLAYMLSQAGMVLHWWQLRDRHRRRWIRTMMPVNMAPGMRTPGRPTRPGFG